MRPVTLPDGTLSTLCADYVGDHAHCASSVECALPSTNPPSNVPVVHTWEAINV